MNKAVPTVQDQSLLDQCLTANKKLTELTEKYERLRLSVFYPKEVTVSQQGDPDEFVRLARSYVYSANACGYRCELRPCGELFALVFVANPKEEL